MAAVGITPPTDIISDGKLQRFHVIGDRNGSKNGWLVFYGDGLAAGSFGTWKGGETHTWCAKSDRKLTAAEKCEYAKRLAESKRQREAELKRTHTEAAAKALKLWCEAKPAPADHGYLVTKQVKPCGLRVDRDGRLLIPIRIGGKLASLQTIDASGGKRFLNGGEIRGGYHALGKPDGVVYLCEGVATGLSIREAVGGAVAVCFSAGNLHAAAEALRAKLPNVRLILCADNDSQTKDNPGLTRATEAAKAVGGLVALPDFGDATADGASDYNDLARLRGPEAVRRSIEQAKAPDGDPTTTSSAEAGDQFGAQVKPATDFKMEPINWIWNGWLAAGALHLIAGRAGTGKTTLALSLAATITAAEKWPDGTQAERGSILMWSGEDTISNSLVPRLLASGGDPRRAFFVEDFYDDDGHRRPFDPACDMQSLMNRALQIPDLRMVIIDPLVVAVAGDSHKNSETRRGLQPLVDLGKQTNAVVLGVTHFSKGTAGSNPLERVTGSLAFGAQARIVFAVAKGEEAGDSRCLVRSKSNLGPDGGGFEFTLQRVHVADDIDGQYVRWGDTIDGSARELLDAVETDRDSAMDDAREFLTDLLEFGSKPAKDVFTQARLAGVAEKTLRRAKSLLHIRSEKDGIGGGWVWRLPAENHQDGQDGQGGHHGNVGHLGRLRQPRGLQSAQDGQNSEDGQDSGLATFGENAPETPNWEGDL